MQEEHNVNEESTEDADLGDLDSAFGAQDEDEDDDAAEEDGDGFEG